VNIKIDKFQSYFVLPQNQLNAAKFTPKIEHRQLKADTFQKIFPPLQFKGADFSKPANFDEDRSLSPPTSNALSLSDPDGSFKNEVLSTAKAKSHFPMALPKLAQGRECAVLELSDKYVYRLPIQDEYTSIKDFDIENFEMVSHFPTRIKSRPLARLGGWTEERNYVSGYIHPKVNGKQGSVDYSSLSFGEPIPSSRYREFTTKYKNYIDDMAGMPQQSYQSLIQDIKALNSAGLCFEPNPNNLMVDTKAQQLNLVDIDDISHAVSKNQFPIGETNNLGYLLSMLIDMSYLNMEKGTHISRSESGRYGDGLPKLRRMIMKKTLQAACTENFIKLPGSNYRLGNGYSPAFSVESMFGTANMDKNDWQRVRTILEWAEAQNSDQARLNASNAIADIFDRVCD
jgi:hypothetical protein